MTLIITKTADKTIRRMDKGDQSRVVKAVYKLHEAPETDQAETVKGTKSLRRYRVGDHRVIFTWDGTDLVIKDVVSRGQAYDPRRLRQLDKD